MKQLQVFLVNGEGQMSGCHKTAQMYGKGEKNKKQKNNKNTHTLTQKPGIKKEVCSQWDCSC